MSLASGKLRQVQFTIAWVFAANLAVALAKLYYGRLTRSIAMQADAYHSMLDALANVIGLVGVSAAHEPADESHPYGHRKFETFAALAVAVLVLNTAVEVFREASSRLTGGTPAAPTREALAVMAATIVVNAVVTVLERRSARDLGSDFLLADSSHTLSDVLVSIGVLASLAFTMAGHAYLDPMVALAVTGIIAWVGVGLVQQTVPVLLDAEAIPAARLEPVILSVEGVASCHKLRSRGRPDDVHVDLHIQVDPALTVLAGHSIAHRVKDRLKAEFPNVTDALIHVEPFRSSDADS
ncbi:MAG: cation transporter [Candidatus Wallbacteria bacterium]|nr:cation transporter [Candidatus Wallbacteria bacterium]